MKKRPFTVKMYFTYDEYVVFDAWYNNECYQGLLSFAFPQIDSPYNNEKEYQFVAGQAPQYLNVSGKIIECTMQWEEV